MSDVEAAVQRRQQLTTQAAGRTARDTGAEQQVQAQPPSQVHRVTVQAWKLLRGGCAGGIGSAVAVLSALHRALL